MKRYALLIVQETQRGRKDVKEDEKKEIDFFTEPEIEYKGNLNGVADIPECRDGTDLDIEYRDFQEEKIWTPQEETEKWIPAYIQMARSCLTLAQVDQGIPRMEALENSSTSYAEQYVTDLLHDSEYLADVALTTLLYKALPEKLVSRWTPEEIDCFVRGLLVYGKDFSTIQMEVLPHKNTKDIVDFFYEWKQTELAKQLKSKLCPNGWRNRPKSKRRRIKTEGRTPSVDTSLILNGPSDSKIVTRSVSARARSSDKGK